LPYLFLLPPDANRPAGFENLPFSITKAFKSQQILKNFKVFHSSIEVPPTFLITYFYPPFQAIFLRKEKAYGRAGLQDFVSSGISAQLRQ
jgi:hypothetical protein